MMKPDDILNFWFVESGPEQWFDKNDNFDREITSRFLGLYEAAVSNGMDVWSETPDSSLALVILLDQFPRNMFRGDPRSFLADDKALSVSMAAIEKGQDALLPVDRRKFLYMPYMHSESLHIQKAGLPLFESLGDEETLKFAMAHHDIIERFGRFPHRNGILGRESTKEELHFLTQPGSSF